MAVEFARQLKDTVDAVSHDGSRDLRFALYMVADILLEAFDSDLQSAAIDRRTASDAAAIARAAAQVVDACCVVDSALFGARAAGCFTELALPPDRNSEVLGDFFEQHVHGLGERTPAVYMIWQREPLRYVYLGTTLDRRGERWEARETLCTALQQGSLITVMVPSPVSAIAVRDLELALLTVLDRKKLLPALNVRAVAAADVLGTAHVAAIARLLCELASKFQVPAERYRDVIG